MDNRFIIIKSKLGDLNRPSAFDFDVIIKKHHYFFITLPKYYHESDLESCLDVLCSVFNSENLDTYCVTVLHNFIFHNLLKGYEEWCKSEERKNKIKTFLKE
jgi:hypothetical protein